MRFSAIRGSSNALSGLSSATCTLYGFHLLPVLVLFGHDDCLAGFKPKIRMNPRGFPPRRPRIRENVNEAIRAREVRAVFPDGSVEVMPTPAAVRKAQDVYGLDL